MKKIWQFIFLFLAIFAFNFKAVADSGWDTDYDFGGGFDSGGYDSGGWNDYDYGDHDYNYGTHTTTYSNSTFLWAFILIALVILVVVISENNKSNKKQQWQTQNKYHDLPLNKLQKYLPNYTIDSIKKEAYDKFVAIQKSWMNFDYDTLRDLCTDELYNSYYAQLEALKVKENQNIKLLNIVEENDLITLYFYFQVSFYDYVIDKNKNVIRGTDKTKITNQYYIQFIRTKGEDKALTNCPNCNAPIKDSASSVCEYCGSTIV